MSNDRVRQAERNIAPLIDNVQARVKAWLAKIDAMISLRRHVLELAAVCDQLRTYPTSFSGEAFELYLQRMSRAQDLMAEITARMEALR